MPQTKRTVPTKEKRAETYIWIPELEKQLRISCREAIREYDSKKKLPEDYEEFKTTVFKCFDGRVKSMQQGVSTEERENFKDRVEHLKREFRSGNRLGLENTIRAFYEEFWRREPNSI